MNVNFWKAKWDKNQIGFHEGKPNALLVEHFKELKLVQDSRIFLPLCGKTLDIAWLLSKQYQVVGIELIEIAVEQLFVELGVEPVITKRGKISRYSAKNIDIFVGDIFDLSSDLLGGIDAIYDRASLIALPDDMRDKYTKHLLDITEKSDQLLITLEYDQSEMSGPPFSIGGDVVDRHYKDVYRIVLLESTSVPGGLKGKCAATENIWLLKKR